MKDILVVEEKTNRGFCSKNCVKNFFQSLKNQIIQYVNQLLLKDDLESFEMTLGKDEILQLIKKPDQVWRSQNKLDEEIYIYVRQTKDKIYHVLISLVFLGEPSYQLHAFKTSKVSIIDSLTEDSESIAVDKFLARKDQEIENEIDLDAKVIETLERKKSEFLARHLTIHKSTDIAIDQFALYESYLPETLSAPDEIYRWQDDEKDEILTYIRSFKEGNVSFFYIVVALHYEHLEDSHEELVMPILCFPSIDRELYQEFKLGEMVLGALKN